MAKDKKRTIYIAGKMSDLQDWGRTRFNQAAIRLNNKGWAVLNPACLPIGMDEEKYMLICLTMLEAADAIYMLSNYEESVGANLELQYAIHQNKEIIFESERGCAK